MAAQGSGESPGGARSERERASEGGSIPLPPGRVQEIRLGVGRLIRGAQELAVIALVMPLFLLGLDLAAEGFSAGGFVERADTERALDRALFAAYAVVVVGLAVRAWLGARRARALLPEALSESPESRARARERILRLGGSPSLRRAAEWVAHRGCLLLIAVMALALGLWLFSAWLPVPIPNPLWMGVFLTTTVGMDVRWRALVADLVDQME